MQRQPKSEVDGPGSTRTWFFVGSALGAFGGGVLTDLLGYTLTMAIGAALTAAGGVVAFFLLPETSGARALMDAAGARSAPASSLGLRPDRPNRLSLRANGGLWLTISLQGVNRFIVSGVVSATLGLLIQDWAQRAGIAIGVATLTGVAMAGRTLLSMVAAPLAGTMSDRQGSRWPVVAWSLGIGTAGMGLLALGGPVWILLGVSTVAVSGGGLQALATALTGDAVDPSQRGRAIGLLHTAGDFGSAIGPSLAYALLPVIGLRALYLLCAAVFLVSLGPVIRFFGKEQGQHTTAQASHG